MKWSCIFLGAFMSCATLSAAQLTYSLSLDTSGFAGSGDSPYLEFNLIGAAGNTVTVSGANFTASTLTLQSSLATLGQDELWNFTPGATTSFTVTTTDIAATDGAAVFGSDVLQILLDDPSETPYATTDANFSTLFSLTLTGGADTPTLYQLTAGPAAGQSFSLNSGGGTTSGVPEPASAGLIGTAGLLLCGFAFVRGKAIETRN